MIFFVLLLIPMPFFYMFTFFIIIVSGWCLSVLIFAEKFFVFLMNVIKLTFLPEKMLEIVCGLYLLFMGQKYPHVIVLWLTLYFDYCFIGLWFELCCFWEFMSKIVSYDRVGVDGVRIQHSFTSKRFKKL